MTARSAAGVSAGSGRRGGRPSRHHPANVIALSDLASVAAASPFHFSRAFASEMDASPYGFPRTRRIITI